MIAYLIFDITGNDSPRTGWLTNETYYEYGKRAQCVINAYESLVVTELANGNPRPRINGKLTLEENVADILGVLLAYNAYGKCNSSVNNIANNF